MQTNSISIEQLTSMCECYVFCVTIPQFSNDFQLFSVNMNTHSIYFSEYLVRILSDEHKFSWFKRKKNKYKKKRRQQTEYTK